MIEIVLLVLLFVCFRLIWTLLAGAFLGVAAFVIARACGAEKRHAIWIAVGVVFAPCLLHIVLYWLGIG